MGRPRKRPEFDPDRVIHELMDAVSESYQKCGSLKQTAEEIGLSPLKVRKLLVTAGVFENETAELVCELFREGRSPKEIQDVTGLGKSAVNGYLPYTKALYKTDEVSLNAERIRVYRKRQELVDKLQEEMTEESLWEAVVAFQGYRFHTVSGLPFAYQLKKGRNGQYNRELLVSRRKESKSLAWSSVRLAFERAKEMQGKSIRRPKEIGDIRGISYIYAMFLQWKIIKGE